MWFFFEDNLIVKKRIRCQKWENCIRKRIAYNLNEIHSPRRGPSRSESLPTSVPFVVLDSIEWNRTNERSALFSNDEPFRLGLTRRRVCGKVGFFPAATASGLFGRRGLATSIAASPFIKKKQSNGLFFFLFVFYYPAVWYSPGHPYQSEHRGSKIETKSDSWGLLHHFSFWPCFFLM